MRTSRGPSLHTSLTSSPTPGERYTQTLGISSSLPRPPSLHSLTDSFTHSRTNSPTHSLTPSLTPSLPHSLTHSPTHSFIHSPPSLPPSLSPSSPRSQSGNTSHMQDMKLVSLLLFRIHDECLSRATIKSMCNVINAILGSSPTHEDLRQSVKSNNVYTHTYMYMYVYMYSVYTYHRS